MENLTVYYFDKNSYLYTGSGESYSVPEHSTDIKPERAPARWVPSESKWIYASEAHPEPSLRWTLSDFRKRFTTEEKLSIYRLAEEDLLLKVFLDDLSAAPEVVQDDPWLLEGVAYLVSIGVISEVRASQILGGVHE
jgi:hypothetical protein